MRKSGHSRRRGEQHALGAANALSLFDGARIVAETRIVPPICAGRLMMLPGNLCIVVRPHDGCRAARGMARHGQGHIQLSSHAFERRSVVFGS